MKKVISVDIGDGSCVKDSSMMHIIDKPKQPNPHAFILNVWTVDGIKPKRMCQVATKLHPDDVWLADIVTGTLYHLKTGRSSSPQLYIVE